MHVYTYISNNCALDHLGIDLDYIFYEVWIFLLSLDHLDIYHGCSSFLKHKTSKQLMHKQQLNLKENLCK